MCLHIQAWLSCMLTLLNWYSWRRRTVSLSLFEPMSTSGEKKLWYFDVKSPPLAFRAEKTHIALGFTEFPMLFFWNDACKIRCLTQTWKPKLDLLTFSTETRFCPLCQELNHKFPLKFSFFCVLFWVFFLSAVSSSKLASDENCCCFALIQFSLKDECSLPSVESNMIKRKDCVPYVFGWETIQRVLQS